jgi:hypothetical protein
MEDEIIDTFYLCICRAYKFQVEKLFISEIYTSIKKYRMDDKLKNTIWVVPEFSTKMKQFVAFYFENQLEYDPKTINYPMANVAFGLYILLEPILNDDKRWDEFWHEFLTLETHFLY